ncbi:MAG: enoyl-CoA hydratase/isomerase family protein [Bdellovibrionaceae bacterium]|nr:enoyl-CoA hydratase/isomerase family protein [Bdellovibrionales bacterium]MCB9083853.1 enoyl-CoA hydratase/isomerase family protein [Pseudobdellovibrionaceae bacterium]
MSIEESLKLVAKGDIAYVEWDLIGEKVNKLSSPVMARLKEIVDELKGSKYKAVILISRKPGIFIAGADIDEIKKLTSREDFLEKLGPAHEILNSLEDLPMPVIAAVNGACMGGGCELIMACDYRIASDDKSTRIGLPEVKLGIIPGFGGCVRMPRIIGIQAALDIILAGKAVIPEKARKIGLVDQVVPADQLESAAEALAQEIIAGKKGKRQKRFKPRGIMNKMLEGPLKSVVFSQAKKMVLKQSKGFYPAPLKALEVIRKTIGYSNRDKALKIEAEGFCEVAVTEISKNLIDLFYIMEAVKKQTGTSPEIKGHKVKKMAVLGAGVMGGGIAQVAADKDIEVHMKDINHDAIAKGYKQAKSIWDKRVQRRRMDKYELEKRMSFISGTLDYQGFQNMDVVVEAIVEDMGIKKSVLGETAKHCSSDVVMATNTSSLSVTEMGADLPHPENFVGMHFFNPVDKMPLVEVIRGEKTNDEATATIFELAKKMGKTPVVVKDGPGFLVNRLLLPWMSEALFLLEDGMSVETLDRIYTHKFGMPMGPCRLMDEVGLDVGMKVLKIFKNAFGDRIHVSKLVANVEGSKRLGRKGGKGFYLYDEKGKETEVDQSIYKELGLDTPTDKLDEKEVIERGMFAMINEAALALIEDRIVEKPEDVDLAMIMGTGFPPFRGGLLRYADSLGTPYIVQELELLATRYGKRFAPTTPLLNMAKTDRKFYAK